MSLFPIDLPPGCYQNGTVYQSKGRWYDCNLVRFVSGTKQPEGGWRKKTATPVTGMGRAILSWVTNNGSSWTAVGTEQKLYAISRSGAVTDITPTSFIAGRVDAVAQGGFGSGKFGVGTFGSPRADSSTVLEASMWSLDTFGQYLVGCLEADGKIYQWTLNTASKAAAVTNAPTAKALFVTAEGMLVALAAEGVARRAKWSDLRDNTIWTADATNSAGDYDLTTNGQLMQGLRVRGGNLLFTDLEVHTMQFTADNSVYSIKPVGGEGSGAISRDCAAFLDNQAVWMGNNGFWTYNGFVQPLPCELWDFVFGNMNKQQKSKVTVQVNSAFGEVTWRIPSKSSIELDRTVTWNYRENHWRPGYVVRLCGDDSGPTQYPLAVGTDGYVYEHEVGYAYDGAMPYLISGPIENGEGDTVEYVEQLLPDVDTPGAVTASFFTAFTPMDAQQGNETVFGPYTLVPQTDARFCASRQTRVRYDGVTNTAWRIGVMRAETVMGGGR